jgi:hypothetical protein
MGVDFTETAMDTTFKKGDRVAWNTPQGEVEGTVEATLTKPTHIETHRVAASPEEPQLCVRSARTGAVAAHRPEALRKIGR